MPETHVGSVTVRRLTPAQDLRGSLVAGEVLRDVPFEVRRFFVVYDVPTKETRGEHAHRTLHQFLVCLRGRVNLMVDDGVRRDVVATDSPPWGPCADDLGQPDSYSWMRDVCSCSLPMHTTRRITSATTVFCAPRQQPRNRRQWRAPGDSR